MAFILALDLGSTQLKLLLMNENAQVLYVGTQSYPTQMPHAGRIEQRPADWVSALETGMKALRSAHPAVAIDAVCFSGHMSGVVLLAADGSVTAPCIMLSDSRSEEQCIRPRQSAGSLVRERTGNPIINAFSLPKLVWLKENEPDAWNKAAWWLSPKDYIRYCMTGRCVTEYTDAYNSLCIDSKTAEWCDDIIAQAGLEREKFPPVLSPSDKAGVVSAEAAKRFGIAAGTPVFAGAADMACGAVGMGLYTMGDAALTLGTCATFLALVPSGSEACFGQVTFHLHATRGLLYALGSHFNGGLAANWITRMLNSTEELDFARMDALSDAAKQVPPGSEGVLTLPFLAGSGSPYFDAADRQSVLGISSATTQAQLFRSQLEGITLNLAQTQHVFNALVDGGLRRVLLGGGGAKISVWPQMIADVFGTPIDVVSNTDASAVGAAILGGVGAGIFAEPAETAARCLAVQQTLHSRPAAQAAYKQLFAAYSEAYRLTHDFYNRCAHSPVI